MTTPPNPGPGTPEGGGAPPPDLSTEPPGAPPKGGDEPKVYDEVYVKKLRDEAAEKRTKAKEHEDRANALASKLLDKTIAVTCKDLADPEDLLAWTKAEDLLGEDGLPDEHKILSAEQDLIKRKPHLQSRKPIGDIDQGGQGEQVETFSFNDWLKNAAG